MRPSPAARRAPRPARAAGALVVALGSILLLSGCAPDPRPPTDPVRSPDETPSAPAELYPDGSAEDNLPFFVETIEGYAAGDGPIEGRPLAETLLEAGFPERRMQLSFDRTKTGLVADNIFLSVRFGRDCLIAQVLTADRSVATEIAPALGAKRDICLIGETRPIDW